MDYKEFSSNLDLEYVLDVTVNGTRAITVRAYDEVSLIEQLRKVDHAIELEAQSQYEDMPENIESEVI